MMIEYKINVIEELKSIGLDGTTNKKLGIFGQSTMQKFRKGDTNITIDNLNRLCSILEMQPRDILKYVETDSDRENFSLKLVQKSIDKHEFQCYTLISSRETLKNPILASQARENLTFKIQEDCKK